MPPGHVVLPGVKHPFGGVTVRSKAGLQTSVRFASAAAAAGRGILWIYAVERHFADLFKPIANKICSDGSTAHSTMSVQILSNVAGLRLASISERHSRPVITGAAHPTNLGRSCFACMIAAASTLLVVLACPRNSFDLNTLNLV